MLSAIKTTLAETVKLGGRAIRHDINPVAYFLGKCALSIHDRKAILDTFRAIERDVADEKREEFPLRELPSFFGY